MTGKTDFNDLSILIKAGNPIITIETHEETRALQLLEEIAAYHNKPLFGWDHVDGMRRIDLAHDLAEIENTQEPLEALAQIKASHRPCIFALCDFHPHFEDAHKEVRLLKEIALNHGKVAHTLIFISHSLDLPEEVKRFSASFQLSLPNEEQLEKLIRDEAKRWSRLHSGQKVKTDSATLKKMVRNLIGMTYADARTLIKNVISDGAITEDELPAINKAKFELLDMDGVLSFEYETSKFSEVGGLNRLKSWLKQREAVFLDRSIPLDPPKGLMLVGVQGGGKSLAAKSVAGMWGVPLLRLDFGALYNKFHGETERNLRESLKMAELMSPCVLWLDEIEKGISTGDNDGGTSQRVLGTLLTWMAEHNNQVFLVATSNDISRLPPELMRKGRMDEIFFVDLPNFEARMEIFSIHIKRRDQDTNQINLKSLAEASEGFTGSEIEQAVVSSLYRAYAEKNQMSTQSILDTITQTSPLSVVMAEKIQALRSWAAERTVNAN
ncbi:AAA family ATPase [Aliikangiella sp. G2MR2-5]|uniref:AAA family ATPase n=1 Tax=Aliikangiella sp. G2MR2-5 TaxID=2788943 RepID=UPI0018A892DE|nr:AAA family ATPase [Aliikangiella sp. G2MR2-5]